MSAQPTPTGMPISAPIPSNMGADAAAAQQMDGGMAPVPPVLAAHDEAAAVSAPHAAPGLGGPAEALPAEHAGSGPAAAPAAGPRDTSGQHHHYYGASIVHIGAELADPLMASLDYIVGNSTTFSGAERDELAPSEVRSADALHAHGEGAKAWISKFFPSSQALDDLFQHEHMGNFVIERTTGRKFFETMPLYVRVGMHLLFVSGASYVGYRRVEELLRAQSIKQGRIYDQTGEGVLEHIQAFVKTYAIPLKELLVQDLTKYICFNDFFSRKLTATARPITAPNDVTVVTSPADCRLTAFQSVDAAKEFWIKGQRFTIPNLLNGDDTADQSFNAITTDPSPCLVVCRLAPQDYHRFHSPVSGTIVSIKDIAGDLYTVNPQAINEDLNVFTLNKRSIMLIHADLGPGKSEVPIAFVSVGAMLVGSIVWTKKPGDRIAKGEELGTFKYGGSTNIVVFPSTAGVIFDQDLVETSKRSMETLVSVGMEIGRASV